VEIRLLGTATEAPTLRSFFAEFPRETYLEHLPAIYREDREGGAFLARYLSLFERIFTDVEADTEAIGRYLDPEGIPADHLSWLGTFLGMDVDGAWRTPVARDLLASAPDLYRMRGTRRGLQTALSIYLDHAEPPTPDWDQATTRESARLDGLVEAGLLTDAEADRARESRADLAEREPAPTITLLSWAHLSCAPDSDAREYFERLVGCPQGLLVLVHPRVTEADRRALAGLVAAQTPAHASVRTAGLRRRVQLAGTCPGEETAQRGGHTYLGVNSTLTDREFALESAGLGEETVLDSHEPDGQLDVAARLGADAHLS
ncbi:MAG: phage tail protein, partial [Halobacteriales archaeon]